KDVLQEILSFDPRVFSGKRLRSPPVRAILDPQAGRDQDDHEKPPLLDFVELHFVRYRVPNWSTTIPGWTRGLCTPGIISRLLEDFRAQFRKRHQADDSSRGSGGDEVRVRSVGLRGFQARHSPHRRAYPRQDHAPGWWLAR